MDLGSLVCHPQPGSLTFRPPPRVCWVTLDTQLSFPSFLEQISLVRGFSLQFPSSRAGLHMQPVEDGIEVPDPQPEGAEKIQTWVSLVSPLQVPGLGHPPAHCTAQGSPFPLCVADAQAQACTNPVSHLPCTQLSFDPQPDLS